MLIRLSNFSRSLKILQSHNSKLFEEHCTQYLISCLNNTNSVNVTLIYWVLEVAQNAGLLQSKTGEIDAATSPASIISCFPYNDKLQLHELICKCVDGVMQKLWESASE